MMLMGSGVSYGDQSVTRAIISPGSARGKEAPPQYAAHRMVARRRNLTSFTAFGCFRSSWLVRVSGRIAVWRCCYFGRDIVRLMPSRFGHSGFCFVLSHCLFQAGGAVVMMAAAGLACAHIPALCSGSACRQQHAVVRPTPSGGVAHAPLTLTNICVAEDIWRPRHAAPVPMSTSQATRHSAGVKSSAAGAYGPLEERAPSATVGGLPLD